jgi:hypothetical protein
VGGGGAVLRTHELVFQSLKRRIHTTLILSVGSCGLSKAQDPHLPVRMTETVHLTRPTGIAAKRRWMSLEAVALSLSATPAGRV